MSVLVASVCGMVVDVHFLGRDVLSCTALLLLLLLAVALCKVYQDRLVELSTFCTIRHGRGFQTMCAVSNFFCGCIRKLKRESSGAPPNNCRPVAYHHVYSAQRLRDGFTHVISSGVLARTCAGCAGCPHCYVSRGLDVYFDDERGCAEAERGCTLSTMTGGVCHNRPSNVMLPLYPTMNSLQR